MKEDVSAILEERAKDTGGVNRMIAWSIGVHVSLLTLALVVPRNWLFAQTVPPKVMTISLGALGSKPTGIAPMAARSVEKATPEPKRPEVVKPATPRVESAIPIKSTVKPKVDPDPEKGFQQIPITRAPTTGREVTQGNAVAETGSKGVGTGLSSGAAAGANALGLPQDFCCPAYGKEVIEAIERNWLQRSRTERGETVMQFTIQRDGTITGVQVLKSSGIAVLDLASRAALGAGLLFKPLPPEFKEQTLTIRLAFPYNWDK